MVEKWILRTLLGTLGVLMVVSTVMSRNEIKRYIRIKRM